MDLIYIYLFFRPSYTYIEQQSDKVHDKMLLKKYK